MRNTPIIQSHSDAATYNFPALPGNQLFAISVLASFSDTSFGGTVKLQASNDEPPAGQLAGFTPTNWVDIPNTSQSVTSGAAVLVPYTQVAYQWIRVVMTQSSAGTGTATMSINAQSF